MIYFSKVVNMLNLDKMTTHAFSTSLCSHAIFQFKQDMIATNTNPCSSAWRAYRCRLADVLRVLSTAPLGVRCCASRAKMTTTLFNNNYKQAAYHTDAIHQRLDLLIEHLLLRVRLNLVLVGNVKCDRLIL